MLSAQRVNRSFSARTDCRSRTYVYFLPAAALGLRLDGAPPAARPPPARRPPAARPLQAPPRLLDEEAGGKEACV